jgi:hemoglobin-like flavoprotein
MLVRSSWPAVAADAEGMTTRFYEHLFAIDAGAARLVTGTDMREQRGKLAQMLEVLVNALDDPDQLVPVMAALGKRHTHYGVELRHFDSVGEALTRAIGETPGVAFTPAVRQAWSETYALVASVMRRALTRPASPA